MVYIRSIVAFVILSFISGCELIPSATKITSTAGNYGYPQYYLAIKAMKKERLLGEIRNVRKTSSTDDKVINELKLALLYCLPSSPIHNPYNAKDILNKLDKHKNPVNFTTENIAFFILLKDALNQQLFVFDKYNQEVKNQHETITALKQELRQLKAKLSQLKSIETKLNERG